ncbi:MAG: lamin tail domain-containing protein [Verrucomicrobia bacterium]|nr:lamin tail domain-containing protein [Verrucomicrobiota bacterium]
MILTISAEYHVLAQSVLREYWLGIDGTSVGNLTSAPEYPDNPSGRSYPEIFEAPSNWADFYGTRMRGYVHPPETGEYIFWISGDDNSELYLGKDESPVSKKLIAQVLNWTSFREWEERDRGNYAVQKSDPVVLEKGKKYYIEALQKEGSGGDHLSVGWQLPGGEFERPIPGERLSPYHVSTNPPSIITQPARASIAEGESGTFRVSVEGMTPMSFLWLRNSKEMSGEVGAELYLPGLQLDDDGDVFKCIISNSLGTVESREATLDVHPERIPPELVSISPEPGATVRNLEGLKVMFSEMVSGVDAGDLLVNGKPALGMEGIAPGPFVFRFPAPDDGRVTVAWRSDHEIYDYSSAPNRFEGGSWFYELRSDLPLPDLVINEFMASNDSENGLADEDGQQQDWIEIYNAGSDSVDMGGMSLTDDADIPGQWVFPERTLNPGEYLVVFASGKDRRPTGADAPLHTNFRLALGGEYIGLYDSSFPRAVISETDFPGQRNNYSYGLNANEEMVYFAEPTPGRINGDSNIATTLPRVNFNARNGIYENAFDLYMSVDDEQADIFYTLDGSVPDMTEGIRYTGPIRVTSTTVIRAAAFRNGCLPSPVGTPTYLLDVRETLKSLPVMSIVTSRDNLYGPNGIMGISGGTYANGAWQPVDPGDYHNPSKHGIEWENPVNVEYWNPETGDGFNVNCGIRIHGSDYFRPRYRPDTKFSFRLYFRGDYGPGRLNYPLFEGSSVESFNQIVLRAGNNDPVNPFIIDELVRRLLIDTGQVGVHGCFVNLFINGEYKGYYNPTERLREEFFMDWHGGGEQWDIINQGSQVKSGDGRAWAELRNLAGSRDLAIDSNYKEVARRLDIVNFIDYLLVNIYADTGDWPHNNWCAAREKREGAKFRFYVWDAEHAFGHYNIDRVNRNTFNVQLSGGGEIPGLYQALARNDEFKRLFADRINKHFFNRGALTDANVLRNYNEMQRELRSVIPNMETDIPRIWVPGRRGNLMQFFQDEGVDAFMTSPEFSKHGGSVPAGFELSMYVREGDIYYTINGPDPRTPFTGETAQEAILYEEGDKVVLEDNALIRARTFIDGEWSALTEASFDVGHSSPPIVVSELMYHPAVSECYEFIEIYNAGNMPYDIGGYMLEGIDFKFPTGTIIGGKGVIVLIPDDDVEAFRLRYPGVNVFGEYEGKLSNGGEMITITDRNGVTFYGVNYGDENGWPEEADGNGPSLELVDPFGNPNDPGNWRASGSPGGTPGTVVLGAAPSHDIRINEVKVGGAGVSALDSVDPGWIEILNTGNSTVDLGQWRMLNTDSGREFIFPADTSLDAGEHLVVRCGDGVATGLDSDFTLNPFGGGLVLYNLDSMRVDAFFYGPVVGEWSIGCLDSSKALTTPTPGKANIAAEYGEQSRLVINEFVANSVPGESDWIEIYNTDTNLPVPLRGLYFETPDAVYYYGYDGYIRPAGLLVFTADGRSGPGNMRFTLPAEGGEVVIRDGIGTRIDYVRFNRQDENVSRGRYPDGALGFLRFRNGGTPGEPNVNVFWDGPRINEIMAFNNGAVANPKGHVVSWIELANTNSVDWDMTGMSVGNATDEDSRWSFPDGFIMKPHDKIVLWCDPLNRVSITNYQYLNTGLNISKDGDSVRLFDENGVIVDEVKFGFQVPGLSIGETAGAWMLLAEPTPGTENSTKASLGTGEYLKINEWMPLSDVDDDWFEIYNPENLPVSLYGYYLSDDASISGRQKFRISRLSYIGAHGYAVVIADEQTQAGPNHANFRLDGSGEMICLRTPFGNVVDTIGFGGSTPGVSQGRYKDGRPTVYSFPNTPTPGASNQLDDDNDSIPDYWEVRFAMDPDDPADAFLDSDDDGYSNFEEFIAGTNPRNPNDHLRLEAVRDDEGVKLRFKGVQGRSYLIEYKDDVSDTEWKRFIHIPTRNVTTEVVTYDPVAELTGKRFFRILVPATNE